MSARSRAFPWFIGGTTHPAALDALEEAEARARPFWRGAPTVGSFANLLAAMETAAPAACRTGDLDLDALPDPILTRSERERIAEEKRAKARPVAPWWDIESERKLMRSWLTQF